MATRTIKASGGDYSTLSGWEATLPATLTSTELAECYNFALSDNVAISGSVTSATNYIYIYTPVTERHDGRTRAVSGTGFRISDATGVVTIRHGANSHVRYEGLEIEQTGANAAFQIINPLSSGSDIRIEKCIIHDTQTGTAYTIAAIAPNLNLTFRNNVVFGNQRSWDTRGATSILCENSTFWRHQAQLGLVSGSELTCRNTFSGHIGGASDDFWSGGTPTGTNNASSDTTATARFTSSVNSVVGSAVFTSVTVGAEDFRLKTGTNALVDVGVTLASVTDDLVRTLRPQGGSYDIGAFERIVSGGNITYSYTGVGGVVFSGTLPNVRGRSVQPSGGIVYSGGASVLRGALRAVTGGLNIAGNAAIIPFTNLQNRIISPVGGVVLAGSAAVLRTLSRVAGGGFILSGHAAIQRSTGGVIVVLGQLNDIIWTKLRIKGGVGTRNDMLNENTYWRQLGSGNSINQVEKDVLTGQGKTGALNEQEKDYWSNL